MTTNSSRCTATNASDVPRMTLPTISVITPSFNQSPFLEQTINSVISQNYPRLDYQIFDGLSTDGSVDIIRKYSPKLSSWVSRRDNGQSDAINQGLREAKGDIVCWINSDDYLCPGALETVAAYFIRHPERQWLIGAGQLLNDNEPPHGVRLGPSNLNAQCLMDWPNNWFCQQATFWRRSILDVTGYLDERLHYLMDWDLWLRFYAYSPPAVVPAVLAGYRYHGHAKCVSATNQIVLEELEVHRKIHKAGAGDLLGQYKSESAERLIQIGNEWARKTPHMRDFRLGQLLMECCRRVTRKLTAVSR